ncbi:MAG: hypothetical protein ABI076_04310 [Acidobacteriaceae bacterium]
MKKTLRFLAVILVLVLLVAAPTKSLADTSGAPCVLGYTVGLFNGVWNTELEAMIGLSGVKLAVEEATGKSDDTYNKEDVGYQLLYNHTGSTAGEGKWQDVAEVFMQRQNELDPSGYFSTNHFYLIWEELNGAGPYSSATSQSSSAFANFYKTVVSEITVAAAAELASLTSAPPTSLDYAAQNGELDSLAAAGRKLLLVAHSQGNLFVNPAYDHIQPVVGSTRVKVVHIAPASPTLRGQYILSNNDLVINALRLDGGSTTIQPNNINIPISAADPSGHTLLPIYLGIPNGRTQTLLLLSNALSALTAPSGCAVTVSPSSSTLKPSGSVTLTTAVNPPPTDEVLNIGYVWSISGNAAGNFNTSSGPMRSVTTSTPTITYTLPSAAQPQTTDTVSVKVLVAKTSGDTVDAETLGTGTATVTVSSTDSLLTPFLGAWNCITNNGYGQTITFYGLTIGSVPPPAGNYGSPIPGADLIDIINNYKNGQIYTQTYNYLTAGLTGNQPTAVDTRSYSNPAAYTETFTISGAVLTSSDGIVLSCTR